MSCSICNGHLGCPSCTPDPLTTPCDYCNGTGYIYYDIFDNTISEEEYNALPKNLREKETCDHCNGTGAIELENLQDWDKYDDIDN